MSISVQRNSVLRLSDISSVSAKKSKATLSLRPTLSTGESSGWSEFSGIISANVLPPIKIKTETESRPMVSRRAMGLQLQLSNLVAEVPEEDEATPAHHLIRR